MLEKAIRFFVIDTYTYVAYVEHVCAVSKFAQCKQNIPYSDRLVARHSWLNYSSSSFYCAGISLYLYNGSTHMLCMHCILITILEQPFIQVLLGLMVPSSSSSSSSYHKIHTSTTTAIQTNGSLSTPPPNMMSSISPCTVPRKSNSLL